MVIGVQSIYNFEKEVGIMEIMKGEVKWHVSIVDMGHRDDFSIPVLQYRWGTENGLTGGFVHIWSSLMRIEVKSQREKVGWFLGTIPNALAVIKSEFTDKIPPNFEEAFDVMTEIRKNWRIVDAKSAQEVFDKIKLKWKELIPFADVAH